MIDAATASPTLTPLPNVDDEYAPSARMLTAEHDLARWKLHRLFIAEAMQRSLDGEYLLTACRRRLHRDRNLPMLDCVLDNLPRTVDSKRVGRAVSHAARQIFERLAMAARRWKTPSSWDGKRGDRRGGQRRGGAHVSGFYARRRELAELAGVHPNTVDAALAALERVRLVELWPVYEECRGEAPPPRAQGKALNHKRVGTLVLLGSAAWDAFGIRQLRAAQPVRKAGGNPREQGSQKKGSKGSPPDLFATQKAPGISARAREDAYAVGDAWRGAQAVAEHLTVHRAPAPSRGGKVSAAGAADVDELAGDKGGAAAPPDAPKQAPVAPGSSQETRSATPACATPSAPPAPPSAAELALVDACRSALGDLLGSRRRDRQELGRRNVERLREIGAELGAWDDVGGGDAGAGVVASPRVDDGGGS